MLNNKKKALLFISKLLFFLSFLFLHNIFLAEHTFSQEKINISQYSANILQKDTSSLIYHLMMSRPEKFKNILDSAEQYEMQIIYTQVNRDKNNIPSFRQFTYRVNDSVYFYPGSLVKLPVLLMSLDKLNNLNIKSLNKCTRMSFDSAYACQLKIVKDTNAPNQIPTIAHYIKQILLVSDNNAYNRLYEFLGQKYMNEKLWSLGYNKACILQKFMGCTYDANKYSPPIKFYNKKGNVIYDQPLAYNPQDYKNPLGNVKKGIAYLDANEYLINSPKDFSRANNLPLQEVNDLFFYTIFPNAALPDKHLNLTENDYTFLYKYFAMYPRESEYKAYKDSVSYPDNLKKYLYRSRNDKHITDENVRILNIVGQAYGYLADCAYIVDFKNKTEFFLTALVYNVPDGIIDPSHYRYQTVGFPFLEELGKLFYDYELTRPKLYKPDLSKLHKAIFSDLK